MKKTITTEAHAAIVKHLSDLQRSRHLPRWAGNEHVQGQAALAELILPLLTERAASKDHDHALHTLRWANRNLTDTQPT
jgi:hypothetical protein